MILHPQTGHGGVRRQPCRSRLPAGRSLRSAALSWSDDDVYRLAASPGQLAPSLLPRELHVERVSCGLSRPTSSGATGRDLVEQGVDVTGLTPHTQLSSNL
eukprot:scaffold9288_cov62-Phaeocystis_antarctica.AAC.1